MATVDPASHVLCIGIPVRDLTFRVPAVPPRGDKAHATHFAEISGGNALNAAIGIARLGGRAAIAGPMGPEGSSMLDDLAREGIKVDGITRHKDVVTPISAIMIDEGGERTIVTYRDPKLMQTRLDDTDNAAQELRRDPDRKPLRTVRDRDLHRGQAARHSGGRRWRPDDVIAGRPADRLLAHHFLARAAEGDGGDG